MLLLECLLDLIRFLLGAALFRKTAWGMSRNASLAEDGRRRMEASGALLRAGAERFLERSGMSGESGMFMSAASRAMEEERRAILAGDWRSAIRANCRARAGLELTRRTSRSGEGTQAGRA